MTAVRLHAGRGRRAGEPGRSARSAGSTVACGPAASSAIVTAEMASSKGNCAGSTRSRSMSTDVSISPRGRRESATRSRILIDDRVEVLSESPGRYSRRSAESGQHGLSRDEHALSQRDQLTDGHAVARHDECFPFIQGTHDAPAVIAQLSLCDAAIHEPSVAPTLRLKQHVADSWPIAPFTMRGRLMRRFPASQRRSRLDRSLRARTPTRILLRWRIRAAPYQEWLRDRARRRHSNLAATAAGANSRPTRVGRYTRNRCTPTPLPLDNRAPFLIVVALRASRPDGVPPELTCRNFRVPVPGSRLGSVPRSFRVPGVERFPVPWFRVRRRRDLERGDLRNPARGTRNP